MSNESIKSITGDEKIEWFDKLKKKEQIEISGHYIGYINVELLTDRAKEKIFDLFHKDKNS